MDSSTSVHSKRSTVSKRSSGANDANDASTSAQVQVTPPPVFKKPTTLPPLSLHRPVKRKNKTDNPADTVAKRTRSQAGVKAASDEPTDLYIPESKIVRKTWRLEQTCVLDYVWDYFYTLSKPKSA